LIITIDGPASSGKGTLAKQLAEKLNFIYIDTGGMYRALTYYCLTHNIDVYNEQAVSKALPEIAITLDEKRNIYVNDENVTTKIRTDEISRLTSNPVSTYKAVREGIVQKEREMAQNTDIIVDGRDSGTVVFPQAEFKFFISAALHERARRRHLQNVSLKQASEYQTIMAELAKRDRDDILRPLSPLQIATDGIVVDTTDLSAEEALEYVYSYIQTHKK